MNEPMTSAVCGTIWEDGTAIVRARLLTRLKAVAVQSNFTSITRKVYDRSSSTPDTAITAGTETLTVSNVVSNTLTDWDLDSTGYNFIDSVPATCFTTSDHVYLIEYKITASTGEIGWMQVKVSTAEVITS